jgi:ATP-dependent DNA helicase RecQ
MDKAKQILKDVFGYNSYRQLQDEIIQHVLSKKDALVVMPTGGGKSLCYQIPSLIFEGLTIVISPLISLMKDQVEQLRQVGVDAALLNSSLAPGDYQNNLQNVSSGKSKLLYIAPESLAKSDISNLLEKIKLDCITVDEAHCISEWGHDFRKDYRQLGFFRKNFPSAVCIGLTATATPRVQQDIIKNLDLLSPRKFVASFDRENLFLQVIPKRDSFKQTVDFLKVHAKQSGIIYCFSRRQVDELHANLSPLGFSTKPYHAGLSDEERNKNQDLFIKDEVQIIVATIAFGMGINKSNVRFVLHHDLPKNLESYYQEIGRAGRDGLRADCLLLFSYSDTAKINYFIEQKENEIERRSAKAHLDVMVKYAESEICRRNPLITYFGESYEQENCKMCDNCLAVKEEMADITVPAQKFLSTVKRTGEIYGANYIIDVLTGADSERISRNNHHELSVYSAGKEFNKKQWHVLSHQFIQKKLVTRDAEHGSIKLTPNAYKVLRENERVFGLLQEPKIEIKKGSLDDDSYDEELFEILRRKRKELADVNNVPPYVIFSDKSLVEMAKKYPVSDDSFLQIYGVGRRKLRSFGDMFISTIKKYTLTKNIQDSKKSYTSIKRIKKKLKYEITAQAYNKGSSIEKLADLYNVKEQTIVDHLERYACVGNEIRTDVLVTRISLPHDNFPKIFNAFKIKGIQSLKIIKETVDVEVSYDDLHLLRIVYLNDNIE